ncbi:phosphatidylinositol n-acetylglucosaminyltransferase domain-containing protein [Ditylenchus destructor]|uniref:Phosphatidylinositol n-acetylglucosaminyltransferase domain-containing protein n=1 Tax=Ditylenchus destructor TaxID=166010 RepID=A0AAD4MZX0_9BILA|nr:phosphatidylinositol n-acetylglucosaminyltransferase domain-containing protein [Ditylenchus destructor]
MGLYKEESYAWSNALYKASLGGFPDNYSDEKQFLSQLKKNVTVVRYTFGEAVAGACRIMGQVDIVCLYLLIFEHVQMKQLEAHKLLALATTFALFCGALYMSLNFKHFTLDVVMDRLRTLITLLLFGYGFIPLIRTLTTSISTDTIYAVSISLFFLSLIFHDYGMNAPIVSTTFSVNLSFASSIFLISRVENDELAFYLMALSLCAFCFWPRLRNTIFQANEYFLPPALLALLCPVSIILVYEGLESLPLTIIHANLHVFIVLMCPYLLVHMQRYKNTIHGPWDEASLSQTLKILPDRPF